MYLDIGEPETVLLRTHTSPVQIHLMEEAVRDDSLPIHAVMPGKCFRLDTPDARHLPVFNQIEGLVVDRGITFGDLAGTIQVFTEAYFGAGMQSRLRPAYFPFTEPSAEFEITCAICLGEGCRTCSHTGWIELGGVHHGGPRRLRRGGDRCRGMVGVRLRLRHRPPGADAPRGPRHALVPGERHPLPLAVLTSPANEKEIRARSAQLAP
jgi:phenylalanyl-tRNA synthetase alpha chain